MKSKIKLTTLLLLISLIGFGQVLPKEKSENHVQIKGTNIFMIPPASFESSTRFKGFKNPATQTSMIMIMEIPGPYSEITKGFNSEELKIRGMELKTKKEIKVADYDGLLIELEQSASGMIFSKQILIYGDEKSSTFINGVYLKDSLRLGEKIKESILSTIVDSEVNCNPREALNYSLNESVGSLKFLSVMGNGILFNRDQKIPTESADKVTLITDKSFAKVAIKDKKSFCISRLNKNTRGFSVIESKGINEIEIDNLKGYELFGGNSDNEEMCQVILFDNDGGYYLLVGTYLAKSEKARTDINSIIRTFHRK